MRKLTYFVACSIDGFIGDPNGDATSMFAYLDEEFLGYLGSAWPETVATQGREQLGLKDAENLHFDTVIQGRGSYQLALDIGVTSPYGHLREYVASRSLESSKDPNVTVIEDDLVGRIRELKAEESDLGIWLCGGSQVAGELLDEIDELVIKTYPQVYGAGMPMFGTGFAVTDFTLEGIRTFGNGVLVRTYARKR
ncbi:dihydrofolate reductase family protein [Streptomyces cinnabarinus]|uniref:Dihydrofolate reductase family protein n=1 Tax=Streptomyces cinnabarinus TaxID=67287 RepID=A0ABY7KHP5_9ACTN|nr:dihydrofolate reductase family protein [Streptomyces cinnabarinus]WAZ24060.1 dihydrofolate reductase family protein [Streptomyces cinnabarinus]